MIFGPFLCSTTFTITNDLRCRGYSSSSSSARKRKRQNSTFLFLVFIDHRIPRFGRKYYARIFEFSGRGPAVSLNTSGIARFFFLFRLPLSCRIVNTSRLARIILFDTAILPRTEKRLPIPSFFLFAQQQDWLSRDSLIAWPEFLTTGHARSI